MTKQTVETTTLTEGNANRDPITGEPGSHPAGTGVGAASAGMAGMAIGGAIGGPVGAVVGGAVGAVAGAYAGHAAAESIDPTTVAALETQRTVLRENFASRPYAANRQFADYQDAYDYGLQARSQYAGRTWDSSLEQDLERGWQNTKAASRQGYSEAKDAVRDAWHVTERVLPGDADGDGR